MGSEKRTTKLANKCSWRSTFTSSGSDPWLGSTIDVWYNNTYNAPKDNKIFVYITHSFTRNASTRSSETTSISSLPNPCP